MNKEELVKEEVKEIEKHEPISLLKISKRENNIKPKLAVITTFFNPNNYINIKHNYLKFSEKIKQKCDLFPIELSFNGEFFIEDENLIKINGDDSNILWQKERLLNICLQNIPKEYTNIAWVDCDIIFENENWVNEVNEKLNYYKVLHLFENAKRLDENNNVDIIFNSIICNIKDNNEIPINLNNGVTGFGWAIRREEIEKIGFLDTQIIGGADALMFFSFVNKNNTIFHQKMNKEWYDVYLEWSEKATKNIDFSINNISGDIIHLYHGNLKNRNYNNRYRILSDYNFNPKEDMIIDKNGLWKFKDESFSYKIFNYFQERKEDDNVININDYFDNIYVLNLDRRSDRLEKTKSKLNKLGIKFKRFSAIDGNNLYGDYDFTNFVVGKGMLENKYALACFKSHIEIVKDAKLNNYNRILIFEDDILISKDIHIHIQKLKNIKNWKLLYFGSSQYDWNVQFIEDFFISKKTHGTFAYAIDSSIYDDIINLDNNNNNNNTIDYLLTNIQYKYYGDCYTFYPNICIADVSNSDIRKETNQELHNKKMRWDLLNDYI